MHKGNVNIILTNNKKYFVPWRHLNTNDVTFPVLTIFIIVVDINNWRNINTIYASYMYDDGG
jgi:hypothetical protein